LLSFVLLTLVNHKWQQHYMYEAIKAWLIAGHLFSRIGNFGIAK